MKLYVRQHLLVFGAVCAASFFAADSARAAMALLTADGYTANDTNRGPGVGGDRNEASAFMEVRYNSTAPRKRIAYLKYDISAIDPSTFSSATLSGTFSTTAQDGAGTWNIYGLNDGLANTDDVPDGTFGEANWTEGDPSNFLTYSKGLGVDNSVLDTDGTSQGIDLTEVTFLGTITLPGDAPFQSNTTNLPLAAFLNADTNDMVTFLIADSTNSAAEWRIRARENTTAGNMGVVLNFVPEPGSIALAMVGMIGLLCVQRSGRQ